MYFNESCIFAEFPLNPLDELRAKEDELESLKDSADAQFILYHEGNPLMRRGNFETPLYVSRSDCEGDLVFLGKDGKHAYFAGKTSIPVPPKDGEFVDMRSIARNATANGFSKTPSLLARGKMILDWHNRHQFCANCGNESHSMKGGYARHCSNCDTEHFPRVDPVVIMMVQMGDKCLLGRGAHFLPGMYSALAGFMEPGETIEEAVRREVFEEAGIRVGDVSYIKSQPWPFPSSLMIGVVCEALDDDIRIDPNEIEDAKWFDKNEIENVLAQGGDDNFRVPDKLAIARHLLEHWLNSPKK